MHKMKRIKYKEKSAKNKLNVWSILVYVCTNTTKNGQKNRLMSLTPWKNTKEILALPNPTVATSTGR